MENIDNHKHSDLSEKILQAFKNVYNTLGFGFLDKVYEKAMIIELRKMELYAERQKPVKVFYETMEIGDYYADIIVEEKVIIELKATESILPEHELALVNFLKATGIEVGLLLNFGKTPQHKIKVLENNNQNHA